MASAALRKMVELDQNEQQSSEALLAVHDGSVCRCGGSQVGVQEIRLELIQNVFLNILWLRFGALIERKSNFNIVQQHPYIFLIPLIFPLVNVDEIRPLSIENGAQRLVLRSNEAPD
jgi:hypothetical protein